MLKSLSKAVVCLLVLALITESNTFTVGHASGTLESALDLLGHGKMPSKEPIVLTVTPGDLCREFLGSETSVWASWSYRPDICIRPISCRERENFQIKTRPGSPPEGMLCALYLKDDGQEAQRYVCHKGECVREQPAKEKH